MAPRLNPLHLIAVLAATASLLGLALVTRMPWFWLPLSTAMAATAAGTVFLLRPYLLRWNPAAWLSHGSLPALLLFAATLSLRSFVFEPWWLLGIGWALTMVALGALLFGKYHSLGSIEALHGATGEFLNLATYLTAFLLFVALYRFQPPVGAKIAAVGVVGWLLALELLAHTPATPGRRLILASVVSLSLVEVALSFYFWPQEGAFTAVFLLVGFYLTTGVLQVYLRERLNPFVAVEFLGVAVVSFGFLYAYQAWRLG